MVAQWILCLSCNGEPLYGDVRTTAPSRVRHHHTGTDMWMRQNGRRSVCAAEEYDAGITPTHQLSGSQHQVRTRR